MPDCKSGRPNVCIIRRRARLGKPGTCAAGPGRERSALLNECDRAPDCTAAIWPWLLSLSRIPGKVGWK